MTYRQIFFASLFSLASFSGQAQITDDEDQEDEDEFMVGLMIASDNSIYVGGKDQTQPFPFISFEWGDFYMQGPSIGYRFFEQSNMALSTSIELDGLGQNDWDESPLLKDMRSVDNALMVALNYSYESDYGDFELSFGSDVGGGHEGSKVELSYGFGFPLGGWMVSPEFSVKWSSKEINQYFYGVTAQDVIQGRPLYTPDAGIDYEFGISAMYPFMQRHGIMLRASYETFSSEVTDSPIVDAENSTTLAIGYIYRF